MEMSLSWIFSHWALLILGICLMIYLYGIRTYGYFLNRRIPFIKPIPFLGNMGPMLFRKMSFPDFISWTYNELKGYPYGGAFQFTTPLVVLRDPDLIKTITVKDFEHFTDHLSIIKEEADSLWGKGLFNLQGQRWKDMRTTLSPAFTSSKMKTMFVLVTECGKQLVEFLEKCSNNPIPEECKLEKALDDDDLVAQAFFFFLAGFESTSTLMCFACHQIGVHPEIQCKLQQEIDTAIKKGGGNISYETIHSMKYLDMVISETLRLYPSVGAVDRVCIKPYTLQADPPLEMKPGDGIWIPIYALHRDPEHFPEPDKFDPERFSDENKHNIKPFTYLPFGSGPRICIASRFALMETKIVVVYLLHHFNLKVVSRTPIPLKISKKGINTTVDGGFWMGFEKRNLSQNS